jgi:hypothetical protein
MEFIVRDASNQVFRVIMEDDKIKSMNILFRSKPQEVYLDPRIKTLNSEKVTNSNTKTIELEPVNLPAL